MPILVLILLAALLGPLLGLVPEQRRPPWPPLWMWVTAAMIAALLYELLLR